MHGAPCELRQGRAAAAQRCDDRHPTVADRGRGAGAPCRRPRQHGSMVERQSLAGELFPSCARPAADE